MADSLPDDMEDAAIPCREIRHKVRLREETMSDSLPEDMEDAAITLERASVRCGRARPGDPAYQQWRAVDLRMKAAEFRAEDDARQSITDELARLIADSVSSGNAASLILERFDVTPKRDCAAAMGPGPWEREQP